MNDDVRYDILKSELELCQRQMDKFDKLSATIRTWVVTLWVAIVGWSFQIREREILLLGVFVVVAFWILDAMFKNFRENYGNRRNEVAEVLAEVFQSGTIPEGVSAPKLPTHEGMAFVGKLFRAHIFPLYVALLAVALVLYFTSVV